MAPKQNIYKNAKELPSGTRLIDTDKREWTLGKVIGKGGCGHVYAATVRLFVHYVHVRNVQSANHKTGYCVKVERSGNAPLYNESQFYGLALKKAIIDKWLSDKRVYLQVAI
jgi:hypothetical protein